jgi:hypothetical protein
MSGDKRARLKEWLRSGEITLHPLSFPQRELWESTPVPAGDPANHIACVINIRGKLGEKECRAAIQRVVDRQDALRLSFLPGKEGVLQVTRKTGEANLRFRTLKPAEDHPEAIEEYARELFREPFDMLQGPLYRTEMIRRSETEQVLAFAIHHAVADGWTLGVFVQDLCAAYLQEVRGPRVPLPPVPLTYTAWAASERAYWQPAELEKRAAFWKAQLAGSERIWDASAQPAGSPHGLDRWVSAIPNELANAVRELARRTGTTFFSALLSAFQVTLSRWSGRDDVVVGSPVANRNKTAVRETMGYFAGIVPLRGRVETTRTFADYLRRMHENALDCFANAMPFAELAKALGDAPAQGHHPVFEVRFALQNHPIPDVDLPGLAAKLRMRSTGTARFHLGCEITEMNDGCEIVWLFRSSILSQEEVEQLNRLYQAILTAVCRSPNDLIAASTEGLI